MSGLKLCIVVASLDLEKTKEYWGSWGENAENRGSPQFSTVVVRPAAQAEVTKETRILSYCKTSDGFFEATVVTPGIVGVVPAFAAGVKVARELGADIIACFHDDLRIDEKGWDKKVVDWFELEEGCGMAGFFGAKNLGAGDIYASPYSPMQLARGGCGSNMEEAEKHGERWLSPRKVVCFDGFSQIGRAELMETLYGRLMELGVVHHCYDSALGAMSMKLGWENWFLPIACAHAGGMTAVGNEKYQAWAKRQNADGDQGFWNESHKILYEELKGTLPLWVNE